MEAFEISAQGRQLESVQKPTPKEQTVSRQFADALLETTRKLGQDIKDEQEKKDILSLLPKDVMDYILEAIEVEKPKFKVAKEEWKAKKSRGQATESTKPKFPVHQIILGAIFERISIQELKKRSKKDTLTEKEEFEQQAAIELLDIMQHPEHYPELKLDLNRNPDIAKVSVNDEGDLIVTEVTDAKAGRKLGYRSYRQFSDDGIPATVKLVVDRLNDESISVEELKKMGLSHLAERKGRIKIADDFKIVIFQTSDHSKDQVGDMIDRATFERSSDIAHFDRLLRNRRKTDFSHSVFSHDDIHSMINFIASFLSNDTKQFIESNSDLKIKPAPSHIRI